MDAGEIAAELEVLCDQALVFHGYTAFMRDYELVVQLSADPRTGIPTEYFRYIFTHCVSATASTALTPVIWRRSLDDRLIDYEQGVELDGYVWGVNWQSMYPGFTMARRSKAARSWSRKVGIPFHEVRLKTNAHDLTLVFSDLRIEKAASGYAPFAVGEPFWDGSIPL